MLEVKNLRKVYKTKKGADVNALDGVSLQFPETGMVFLLGKSGSGKSTLLNVCGGLDSPTDGEIIVKGRSSKAFSQSDFDSYRNTFIGFIFQEYNILNEFTVEDNIALALELQGKPKDKAAINALLEDVDLQGYAKRKPNTLSGGQKQRIAIARALVKSPEIIMADEPTGALDSNTGKQVFETLKKLSRDKLVIVVSHDRDFAEQYGDRIIELKDGKILSDVTKTQEQQQTLSDNLNAVGDVLCVKKGRNLTDADFEKIKAFLKNSDDNVIIANNEKDVDNFKKVSRISDDGAKEVFRDTKEPTEKKAYRPEDSKFIRSKLPIRHASKIGVSGLRSKPIRLFFTVILCTVAFVLFGLLSTLNFYDSEATFKQTLSDTGNVMLRLQKEYRSKVTWYEMGKAGKPYDQYNITPFTKTELENFASTIAPNAFAAAEAYMSFSVRQNAAYWYNNISAFAYLSESNTLRNGMIGTYPAKDNEIAISSYLADVLINCKLVDSNGEALELANREALIGKKATLEGEEYTITGIIDSGEIAPEYEVLKSENQDYDRNLVYTYQRYLSDGIHLVSFVNEERFSLFAERQTSYKEDVENYTYGVTALENDGMYEFPEWSNSHYGKFSRLDSNITFYPLVDGKTAPADNEVVITFDAFMNYFCDACYRLAEKAWEDKNEELAQKYQQLAEYRWQIAEGGYYIYEEEGGKDQFIAFTEEEIQAKINAIFDTVKKEKMVFKIGFKLFDNRNQTALGDVEEFTVSGVYKMTDYYGQDQLYLSDATFDRLWEAQRDTLDYYTASTTIYEEPADPYCPMIFLPYEHAEGVGDALWELYQNDELQSDDSRFRLFGNFVNSLSMVDSTVESMSKVFLYVGLGFALFAVLLFSNFISVSISQKKRDIGILRAVGARSADVFKIFFSESFVIATICVVLSTVGCYLLCNVINAELASGIGISVMVFGIPSFAVLVGIALLTAIVATFLPVYNAAKKKPVESIRAL